MHHTNSPYNTFYSPNKAQNSKSSKKYYPNRPECMYVCTHKTFSCVHLQILHYLLPGTQESSDNRKPAAIEIANQYHSDDDKNNEVIFLL